MTQTVLATVDTQVVSLEIRVDDDDWRGRYTHLEVWRSILGEAGPYELRTSDGWTSAKLPEPAGPASDATGSLAAVQAKTLELVLNELVTVTYTFTGSVPLTFAQCATQLNAALPNLITAGVDAAGVFFIETKQAGSVASIRAVKSDASVMLGLPVDLISYGREARPVLLLDTNRYFYRDFSGQKRFYYKTRFYNSGDATVSDFSVAISGGRGAIGVDPAKIILGFLRTARLNGRVVANQEVVVFNSYLGEQSDGYTILGANDKRSTDSNGYVEFELLRGMTVDVSIPGTALMRRVKVPTDSTIEKFDLLDPAYGDNDVFNVQRVEFPYAERRSF